MERSSSTISTRGRWRTLSTGCALESRQPGQISKPALRAASWLQKSGAPRAELTILPHAVYRPATVRWAKGLMSKQSIGLADGSTPSVATLVDCGTGLGHASHWNLDHAAAPLAE